MRANNPPVATTSGSSRRLPSSQPLVDLSNKSNDPGRHSHVPAQTSGNSFGPSSVDGFLQQQEARVDSFLQSAESRAEAQQSNFQQLIDHVSRLVTSLKNGVTQLFSHPLSSQSLQHNEDLHRRYIELEARHGYLIASHRTLEEQLEEASDKLGKTQEERNELHRLVNGGTLVHSEKVSDYAIQSKWKQLNYAIVSLAATLAKCQTRCPTSDAIKSRLQFVSSSWSTLLGDEDFKELLLHAYLWVLVDRQVFEGRGGIWGGRHAHNLKEIRKDLVEIAPDAESPGHPSPSLRYVSGWITQGSTFFEHFFGRDQKLFQRQVKSEVRGLESFCKVPSNKPGFQVRRAMEDIIETALDLDKMIMSSRAIIFVDWLKDQQLKPLRFDATTMDAIAYIKDLSPQSAVDFAVAPALFKKGNADGYNYDSEMVLCKALVVCE
ncbi:hypothetical protein ACHAPJ_000628 [Fusarium lateritium]